MLLKLSTGPFVFELAPRDVRVSTPAKGSGKVLLDAPEYGAELAMTLEEAEQLIAKLQQVIQEAYG